MMKKNKFILAVLLLIPSFMFAQSDSLLSMLDGNQDTSNEPVAYSFKGTRLINMHTIETLGKGSLDFRISHRFGNFSSGVANLWGIDGPAALHLAFDYSITDDFAVGVGRTNIDQMYDALVKYRLLKQKVNNSIPISLTLIASANIITAKFASNGVDKFPNVSNRLAYYFQAMFARKFSEKLTVQLSPTLVHYNLVLNTTDKNDIFANAFMLRYKLTKRFALTGEYIARLSKYTRETNLYKNSASVGVDIETGGHVFQLFVTNSTAINPVQVIPYTATQWSKNEIRIGFNVSRVF